MRWIITTFNPGGDKMDHTHCFCIETKIYERDHLKCCICGQVRLKDPWRGKPIPKWGDHEKKFNSHYDFGFDGLHLAPKKCA